MQVREIVNYGRGQRSLPFAVFIPTIAFLLAAATIRPMITGIETGGYFVLGLFSWSFVEYLLHRFSFHKPRSADGTLSLGADAHLRHHRATNDPQVVVAPLAISIFMFVAYGILALLTLRSLEPAEIATAGLATGYLLFEHVHFSLHRKTYRSQFMTNLKNAHLAHHFQDNRKHFGVTTNFWDRVFGTN